MTVVSDGSGAVGYAPTDKLIPTTEQAILATNARTLVPVTAGDGTLIGYEAQGVGFIPLAEAQQSGFDIEAVRAKLDGGCEPQIGDPTFAQEYPLCAAPPSPPGIDDTTTTGG